MRHSHGLYEGDVHWQKDLPDDERCPAEKPASGELKSPGAVPLVVGACVVVGVAVVTACNTATQHRKPQPISHLLLSFTARPAT